VLLFLKRERDLGSTPRCSRTGGELFESGVVTGEAKTLHKGRASRLFVSSKKTFAFLDTTPSVEFHRPVLRERPPFVIAQNDKMVAIKLRRSAVDTTGQGLLDSMGRSIYSGSAASGLHPGRPALAGRKRDQSRCPHGEGREDLAHRDALAEGSGV